MNIREVNQGIMAKEMKAVLKIILGNALLGFAYAKWMKPDKIINGGVTSLAMIVEKVTGIQIFYLTIGITILLLIFCLVVLGKGTFFKSIVSSISYNFFFTCFYLVNQNFQINLPVDFLVASLFVALGYYFCISADASTVGMDVIALAIHKNKPTISIAKALRYINFVVLALGLVTYGVQSVVIGILFSLVNSYLLDFFLKKSSEK